MGKVIELKNVTKLYQNGRGIKAISLEVEQGDVFGFLGPNGAGKSTVMKILIGLTRPESGTVKIFGHDIANDYEAAMAKVGCLIEAPAAYEYLSAYKNLQLAARFYPHVDEQRIEEVLHEVGLEQFKLDKVKNYSLGMKQRLGLALAILSEPELVILDEPVNGLDVEGVVDIRNIITKLAREKGTTFFISSHLIHELEMVCNRVGVISKGELISTARVSEISEANLEQYYLQQLRGETHAPVGSQYFK